MANQRTPHHLKPLTVDATRPMPGHAEQRRSAEAFAVALLPHRLLPLATRMRSRRLTNQCPPELR